MSSILIKNALIVNDGVSAEGSVLVDNGVIVKIFKAVPEIHADVEIDASGKYLMPGVIDDHVHFRDPGLTAKADTLSESSAAAAGGVTSFMDMPNTKPQTVTLEALEDKFANAAEHSLINYSYYFGATNRNFDLFPKLDRKHVCGIKLFMGASTGNMLVDDRDSLCRIFDGTDMLIATHCEDQDIITRLAGEFRDKYAGGEVPVECHPLIRSEEACYRSSALAVELADRYGSRLHVLHISTARELSLFEDGRIEDKRITAEACVPHLMFCDKDYAVSGALIKCNPAIKTECDRDALRNAVAGSRIDTVATDHAPHLLEDKKGDALTAVSGMPMLQFSLVCMLELAGQGLFGMEHVVEKMCHAPARLYHIYRRGFIREGYKADFVLVSKRSWTLRNDDIISKCKWSPLEGRTFSYHVDTTIVNGRIVYDDGRLSSPGAGEALEFDY